MNLIAKDVLAAQTAMYKSCDRANAGIVAILMHLRASVMRQTGCGHRAAVDAVDRVMRSAVILDAISTRASVLVQVRRHSGGASYDVEDTLVPMPKVQLEESEL